MIWSSLYLHISYRVWFYWHKRINILSNINTKHFIFDYNVFYYVKSSIVHSLNNNWYFWNFRPFQPIKTHLPWSLRIRGWNLLWTAHKRSPSTTSKKSPQPTNAMVSLLHSVYSIPIFYNAKLTITFNNIFFFFITKQVRKNIMLLFLWLLKK